MFSKDNKKLFKHQLLIAVVSGLAIVITMIGGSYAIFSATSKADEYNVLMVGNLEISYVDTGAGFGDILSLNGAYPISDNEGINSEPYRFSVANTGSITADFKIKILYDDAIIDEDGCEDNLLLQKYIKYKLDNEEPVLLSSKEASDYVIYQSSNLVSGSSEIHEIRIWIDEDAPNSVLGKHFHGKVVIESVQSGIDEANKVEYIIGDSVTLKDGSKWHVLENSTSNQTTVTLLSDYNLNSDGSYDTTCGKDINSTVLCDAQVFDNANNRLTQNNSYCLTPENGCNMYSGNGSSVINDSTVKTWLDNAYVPLLKQSITLNNGTLEDIVVSLPTMEQLALADSQVFDQAQITFNSNWLTTTSYWTSTSSNLNTSYVWVVSGEYNNSNVQNASDNTQYGVRPVIVVSKSNIQ